MTAMTTIGSTQGITKTLSAATSCNATAQMALSCFPGPTAMVVNMLNAVAQTMVTMNPYCHWDCGCSAGMAPDVIIDGSDGLPVELLQFEVGQD